MYTCFYKILKLCYHLLSLIKNWKAGIFAMKKEQAQKKSHFPTKIRIIRFVVNKIGLYGS